MLNTRRPSAIFRAVWAVVVEPVYGVRPFWFRPHIGQKIPRVMPALANLYSSSAIPRIIWLIRVVTSAHHLHPNAKFSCAAHTMRAVVSQPADLRASARFRRSTFERLPPDVFGCAAHAAALPVRVNPRSFLAAADHGVSAKNSASEVNQRRHRYLRFRVRSQWRERSQ